MQNDKLFMKKNTFSFFCMIQKKGIAPYGPNSIESDSGPSWGKKNLGVLGQSIQFHPFLQMNTWCHFCEQNEY